MRPLTAIRTGQGRRWKLSLALLAAAVVFTSGVGSASATDGGFEKKLQKGIDLCFSQGGGLDMDPPFTLDCGFANPSPQTMRRRPTGSATASFTAS